MSFGSEEIVHILLCTSHKLDSSLGRKTGGPVENFSLHHPLDERGLQDDIF